MTLTQWLDGLPVFVTLRNHWKNPNAALSHPIFYAATYKEFSYFAVN